MRLIDHARKIKGWKKYMANWKIGMLSLTQTGTMSDGICTVGTWQVTVILYGRHSQSRFEIPVGETFTREELQGCSGLSLKDIDSSYSEKVEHYPN